MSLPKDFWWGAASAATQIEGAWDEDGKCPSVWDVAGDRIANGETSHVACDHYHRYKEDVALMKELGLKSYRFSVNWCRVIPEKGKVNERGLSFYCDLVDELLAAGIEPMITLYHWDLPLWVHAEGGWKEERVGELFLNYVKAVVDALSDRVRYWITINEPQMFITASYKEGSFAPFEQVGELFPHCVRNCLLAHGQAVALIRKRAKTEPVIGVAMASTAYVPDGEDAESIAHARWRSFTWELGEQGNSLYSDPIFLVKAGKSMEEHLSAEDLKIISQPLDFMGLNIYMPFNMWIEGCGYKSDGLPRGSNGWVVDGRCLYWTIRFYYERYHLPVMVTENGISLNDTMGADGQVHDPERIYFLKDYLANLHRAADELFGCLSQAGPHIPDGHFPLRETPCSSRTSGPVRLILAQAFFSPNSRVRQLGKSPPAAVS